MKPRGVTPWKVENPGGEIGPMPPGGPGAAEEGGAPEAQVAGCHPAVCRPSALNPDFLAECRSMRLYGRKACQQRGWRSEKGLSMAKHYRPFVLARAGELAGLGRLGMAEKSTIAPILRIPERAWDYENGRYSKTHEDHLKSVPDKLAAAWEHGNGYLDISLLEKDDPVAGLHPAEYLIREADARSVTLTALVSAASSAAHLAAAAGVHASTGSGVAIQLPQADWTTINPATLSGLMSTLSVVPGEVDIVVDFEGADGPVTVVALVSELASLRILGEFRSITVGGAAFPDLAGVPQGTTVFPRKEWLTFVEVQRRLQDHDLPTPDFFDHVVQNPDLIELGVDPRFLSISATMRYSVSESWLIAKGELFKGRGTTSKGGAALITPLTALVRHPEYATPIRSLADDWIDAVVSGADTPGAPQKWREWATVRHLQVAAHQLSTVI